MASPPLDELVIVSARFLVEYLEYDNPCRLPGRMHPLPLMPSAHLQSAPLREAEMGLKNFKASKGNVRYLETAHDKAMTALVTGHTLDVKLSASIIAVSAGYVHTSKVIPNPTIGKLDCKGKDAYVFARVQ